MLSLRKVGVNTKLMARMKATPMVAYGIDVTGAADSTMQKQRSAIARAAAPEGGGKKPFKVLYSLDGNAGTLDPAFDAHCLPLKHWALAWWDGCSPQDALNTAYGHTRTRLQDTIGNCWNKVAGPCGALHLSLARMGWKCSSATTVCDAGLLGTS